MVGMHNQKQESGTDFDLSKIEEDSHLPTRDWETRGVSRREFLQASCLLIASLALNDTSVAALAPTETSGEVFDFVPLEMTSADGLDVPKGYQSQVLIKAGQLLRLESSSNSFPFGANNDYLAVFPGRNLAGKPDPDWRIMTVNHEFPDNVSEYIADHEPKSPARIKREKGQVGLSVVALHKVKGEWQLNPEHHLTRNFSALGPEIGFSGPAAKQLERALGTLANCAGGTTPWGTVLSAEENYQDFAESGRLSWGAPISNKAATEKYGWVVEIDPYGELPPLKHTALGRFRHESVAVIAASDKPLVAYMGDDQKGGCLYKWVSREKFQPNLSRKLQRNLLVEGSLWVADTEHQRWISLDRETIKSSGEGTWHNFQIQFNELMKREPGSEVSQAEILINAREAALAVGGTRLNRPEDIEFNPIDGKIYIALTNNSDATPPDFHGSIFTLNALGVHDSCTFEWAEFLRCGPESGLSCPDNLLFDTSGNLLVACDISTEWLGKERHQDWARNALYLIPTHGPNAGKASCFLIGPPGCELTGPCWLDSKTLAVSVQHPGEGGFKTSWPNKPGQPPSSAVVLVKKAVV